MKLLLRSKNWWKIVNDKKKELESPTKSTSSDLSTLASFLKKIGTISDEKKKNDCKFVKLLADWHKKNTKAITLFVCNINFNLLDKIHVDDTTKVI